MAQIIKHRRGSLSAVKDVTARVGELIMATGSIGNLNGPVLFIGNTEGVAGAYSAVSKIYNGTTVPTINLASYGSTIDGTPFYASGNNTLYILNKDGNIAMNLVGNIQGNTISNVTITALTGSNASFGGFVSASALNVSGSTQVQQNLFVGGTTSLAGNLNITGSTVQTGSISMSGNAIVGGFVSASALNVTGSTQVQQNLFVGGTTNLAGNLNITGSTVQTGSINLSGDVRVGGNIFIGDNPLDVIVFGGEVSSSIVPEVNNVFDLGSPSQSWNDLYVSGTAYITNIQLDNINVNSLALPGNLTVSGTTTLSGSVLVEDLTNNRVVIVGTNGLLEDDANFTFDGSKLNIGVGDFEVDVATGNVRTSGSLLVNSTSELKGAVGMNSTLAVTGSSQLKGAVGMNSTLDVTGAVTLKSTLAVSGSTQFAGTVDVNGQSTLASANVEDLTNGRIVLAGTSGELQDSPELTFSGTTKLNIGQGDFEVDVATGNVRTSGSLLVNGTSELKGAVGMNSTLAVTGSSQLKGAVGMNSTLAVTGAVTLKSTLAVSGSTQFAGTVDVNGQTTLASANVEDLTNGRIVLAGTSGELQDSAELTFSGTTKLNIGQGDFEVDVTDGNIRSSGSLVITNTSQLKGAVGMNSTLAVTGAVNLKSTLLVTGSSQFVGAMDVDSQATFASANVQDLTSGRIVLAGTSGELQDNADLTFNGTKFVIGQGDLEIDVATGNLRTSGSISTNTLNIVNNLNVGGALAVTGNTSMFGDLIVSGNVQFLGTATQVNISSSNVQIDDNIITLNAFAPFQRYAGLEVIDSGSAGISASLIWDSQNDYWMFVSSSGQSSRFVGTTAGTYGSETSLTTNTIPKATAGNTIGNSLLTDNATTLAYNTNKFTVAASDGATLIAGNVTLSAAGGSDAGTNTSAVLFRNSSNVLGYISTTATTNELTGILGYRTSNGNLEFSSLIDGGTY